MRGSRLFRKGLGCGCSTSQGLFRNAWLRGMRGNCEMRCGSQRMGPDGLRSVSADFVTAREQS